MNESAASGPSASALDGTASMVPLDAGPKIPRDSLFGRLALHNGFVDQHALDEAIGQQKATPTASLADILVQRGTITVDVRRAVEQLLHVQVAKYNIDRQQSLSALPVSSTEPPCQPTLEDTVTFVPIHGNAQPQHTRFGEYELLGEIARGGMGVVYKARQAKLNRLVALKMIRSGELADEEQVKRFYVEAEAAAKLDHPGIVPVYEVGEANGQHFFSMALVVGTSLNNQVKNDGPLPPKEATRLLKLVVEAVEYAHGKGIIHRDIKPQNILLDEAGQPRLTDFGLAKQVMGHSELTATGQVMGTPSYMPPEQARGKLDEIGPTSDVYSLGATLYFVLTGRPPFQTASTAETIQQVLNSEPVALRKLNSALPRDLETICFKCLRKESAKRYGCATELAADLGRWLENRPILARPVGPVERSWLWCKRRPAVVSMSLLWVVFSVVGTLIAIERQRATRAAAMVESLLVAPPQAIPYIVENLTPLRGYSLPILRQRLADESRDPSQRLHAAEALASFGEVDVPFLVASIPKTQSGECANIVSALRGDRAAAIVSLKAQFVAATSPTDQCRLAVMLLHFGEVKPSQELLALAPDPSQRTLFIHHLHEWRGNLADYAQMLRGTDAPDFQSGLCQAIGQIDVIDLTVDERQALESVLKNLYVNSVHSSTHSSAKWTLQQWHLELPNAATAEPVKPGRDWYVNPLGMTFLKIPAGSFEREAQDGTGTRTTVTLSRAFWLGDCEVTKKQFEAFIADIACPPGEKPKDWKIFEQYSPTVDCPVNSVSWFDAVLFCNWLSRREGLSPYYERIGEKQKDKYSNAEVYEWRSVPQSSGYRLPTEAEWEYACRSRSATNFCFGNDESLLSHYAVFHTDKTQPVSSRQPNGWGLFDMHGNVWEWNNDWFGLYVSSPGQPIIDPAGPSTGDGRVSRGGSFFLDNAPTYTRSANRNGLLPTFRIFAYGFRVAREYPSTAP